MSCYSCIISMLGLCLVCFSCYFCIACWGFVQYTLVATFVQYVGALSSICVSPPQFILPLPTPLRPSADGPGPHGRGGGGPLRFQRHPPALRTAPSPWWQWWPIAARAAPGPRSAVTIAVRTAGARPHRGGGQLANSQGGPGVPPTPQAQMRSNPY